MVRLLKQFLSNQKGQALPLVLCLLALGGLTIAINLDYASTSLTGTRITGEHTEGIYAAGAGVEHALWSLAKGYEPLTQLSENVSQMEVSMSTDNQGTFTLYLGQLLYAEPPQVHVEWLDVSGEITDLGGGVYQYTVTVTWQEEAPSSRQLEAVGARLPVGYEYQAGSAALFAENLATHEPEPPDGSLAQDMHGAWMVNWELGAPHPEVSEDEPEKTQIFRITGTGSTQGHYACAEGQPESVGPVGQIKGTLYEISANATRPEDGRIIARIVSDVMVQDDGTMHIASWQILNQ